MYNKECNKYQSKSKILTYCIYVDIFFWTTYTESTNASGIFNQGTPYNSSRDHFILGKPCLENPIKLLLKEKKSFAFAFWSTDRTAII